MINMIENNSSFFLSSLRVTSLSFLISFCFCTSYLLLLIYQSLFFVFICSLFLCALVCFLQISLQMRKEARQDENIVSVIFDWDLLFTNKQSRIMTNLVLWLKGTKKAAARMRTL